MNMLSSSILILSTLLFVTNQVQAYPHIIKVDDRLTRRMIDDRCRNCETEEECAREPEGGCMNGVYKDRCGHVNCSRGPGEYCDDSGRYKCAPTLLCKCNVCKGCQKNRRKVYQCFYGKDEMCMSDLPSEEKF